MMGWTKFFGHMYRCTPSGTDLIDIKRIQNNGSNTSMQKPMSTACLKIDPHLMLFFGCQTSRSARALLLATGTESSRTAISSPYDYRWSGRNAPIPPRWFVLLTRNLVPRPEGIEHEAN